MSLKVVDGITISNGLSVSLSLMHPAIILAFIPLYLVV